MHIACVHQAPSRSVGCPPQPSAMRPRIPVGAGGNGLCELDSAAGFIHHGETKTRPLVSHHRQVICRKCDPGTKGHGTYRPRGHTTNRPDEDQGKQDPGKNQTTPFPSTIWM